MGSHNRIGDATPVITSQVGVLIQEPFLLVRDCLRLVVEDLQGARVVGEATTPEEALATARRTRPDIAFIDLDRPESALPLLNELRRDLPETKVICIADNPDDKLVEEIIAAGALGLTLRTDSVEELSRALEGVRSGRRMITLEAAGPLLDHYLDVIQEKRQKDAAVIEALASAVEASDRYTAGHTRRVAVLATRIASVMDPALGSNEQLRYGFVLHDIGKIGVPDSILRKQGNLTRDEWQVMRRHPDIGVKIISPIGFGKDVVDVVHHHHEKWDGSGYPGGLAGEDIPVGARIFAVADAYDAMTSDRPYRSRLPSKRAVREIRASSGTQFDLDAVKAFAEALASGNGQVPG